MTTRVAQPTVDFDATAEAHTRPQESLLRLFLRFLRFGFLAWGGPVAQIAMIRQELVEEEGWVSGERFNRVLAVYQVLPGPEAHELCVYFGMVARGRIGGLLGGLGFMLPGLALMITLSWFYAGYGITPVVAAVFYGLQPAVTALIARAVHHIGHKTLTDRWLLSLALVAGVASLQGLHFAVTLALAGLAYALVARGKLLPAVGLAALLLTLGLVVWLAGAGGTALPTAGAGSGGQTSTPGLFVSGLRSGLLTFGGAYTVIPFLQRDAVILGGWMTNAQFLDGLALSGILPAPLVIFGTFVGYMGGGLSGALALTAGIFLPAFGFTLVGHTTLERLVENRALHAFLDGVTAVVVGLIGATSIGLLLTAVKDLPTLGIFALAVAMLYGWKSKLAVPGAMLVAGILGWLFFAGG